MFGGNETQEIEHRKRFSGVGGLANNCSGDRDCADAPGPLSTILRVVGVCGFVGFGGGVFGQGGFCLPLRVPLVESRPLFCVVVHDWCLFVSPFRVRAFPAYCWLPFGGSMR